MPSRSPRHLPRCLVAVHCHQQACITCTMLNSAEQAPKNAATCPPAGCRRTSYQRTTAVSQANPAMHICLEGPSHRASSSPNWHPMHLPYGYRNFAVLFTRGYMLLSSPQRSDRTISSQPPPDLAVHPPLALRGRVLVLSSLFLVTKPELFQKNSNSGSSHLPRKGRYVVCLVVTSVATWLSGRRSPSVFPFTNVLKK